MHVFIRNYLKLIYYTSQTCLRRQEECCWARMAAIRGSHSWFSSSACGVGLVSGRVSATVFWECKDLVRLLARDVPYQMRQHANNTLQELSMSCAYQKFRVHRHLNLRVLSTTARVPHIDSGRNSLEFSLDHGRGLWGVASCGTRSSCHALVALLPTCQCPQSSSPHRPLVLDERVYEEDLICVYARF